MGILQDGGLRELLLMENVQQTVWNVLLDNTVLLWYGVVLVYRYEVLRGTKLKKTADTVCLL